MAESQDLPQVSETMNDRDCEHHLLVSVLWSKEAAWVVIKQGERRLLFFILNRKDDHISRQSEEDLRHRRMMPAYSNKSELHNRAICYGD